MAVKIIIMTHGQAGQALYESAKMLIGEQQDIQCFSLLPGMSMEELMNKVKVAIRNNPGPTLFLVDLYGGTPSNVGFALTGNYHARCVSGINMGMLIEVLIKREANMQISLEELQQAAVLAGKESCKGYQYIQEEEKK